MRLQAKTARSGCIDVSDISPQRGGADVNNVRSVPETDKIHLFDADNGKRHDLG
jgi:hypothetical protein